MKYDFLFPTQALDWYVGGGLGAGHAWWFEGERSLRLPYFPVRAEAGALVRFEWIAVQGAAYGQLDIPGVSTYTDAGSVEKDVGWGFYGHVGVELAVFYGRFDG